MVKNKRVKNKFFQCAFFPKNRRGWVKVLEVFVSIILVMGLIFFILSKASVENKISEDVYNSQILILKKVQLNESLRDALLDAEIPSDWGDFSSGGLLEIRQIINQNKLNILDCEARICGIRTVCEMETEIDKDVYVQSIGVGADSDTYSPRQLKLFCWEK